VCPGVSCKYTTPLEGLIGLSGNASEIIYSRGCNDMSCQDITNFSASAMAVSSVDAGILVIGLSQLKVSEFRDRTTLRLPGYQEDLIYDVVGAASGWPLVLEVVCGGPVDISFAKNDSSIPSILWVGYLGEAGGPTIAKVIFGDHNPSSN
jgi:beta-D-xylosidase 4